jgi:hypothetical protein
MKYARLTWVLLGAFAVSSSAQSWTPSPSQIEELESKIHLENLPYWKISKLPLLPGYERFYAGSMSGEDRVILGELIVPDTGEKPGIHVVPSEKSFPMVWDGACSVIHLTYSEKLKGITSITCNGRA